MAGKSGKKGKPKNKKYYRYVLKCSAPVQDEIIELSAFEQYLTERIKVDGKTGMVGGDSVQISRDDRTNELILLAKPPFSKRYLKYLTKKFLKKQMLRDYICVIADSTYSYELRYFNIHNEDA